MEEDDVFPCLALPHSCCDPVSCVLCPQLDRAALPAMALGWCGSKFCLFQEQNWRCTPWAMGAGAGVALQCPVPTLQGHPQHSHSLPVSLQLQQPLELQGSSFPCRAGVPQGFQAASELSCPVRYVESIQDGHLLALKQSSASSKISLPCSGCLLLKRYRHVLAVKERGGWGNHCCCCH